jgi:hypothetical protein
MIPRRVPFHQPHPSELGAEVTIAIVALTTSNIFVHVSDRAISFGDITPASDGAAIKSMPISANWSLAWATNDIKYLYPIYTSVRYKLGDKINTCSTKRH